MKKKTTTNNSCRKLHALNMVGSLKITFSTTNRIKINRITITINENNSYSIFRFLHDLCERQFNIYVNCSQSTFFAHTIWRNSSRSSSINFIGFDVKWFSFRFCLFWARRWYDYRWHYHIRNLTDNANLHSMTSKAYVASDGKWNISIGFWTSINSIV